MADDREQIAEVEFEVSGFRCQVSEVKGLKADDRSQASGGAHMILHEVKSDSQNIECRRVGSIWLWLKT